jgi:hypothetical protein
VASFNHRSTHQGTFTPADSRRASLAAMMCTAWVAASECRATRIPHATRLMDVPQTAPRSVNERSAAASAAAASGSCSRPCGDRPRPHCRRRRPSEPVRHECEVREHLRTLRPPHPGPGTRRTARACYAGAHRAFAPTGRKDPVAGVDGRRMLSTPCMPAPLHRHTPQGYIGEMDIPPQGIDT